jgi:GNAT superfamily N-acetyltransferase
VTGVTATVGRVPGPRLATATDRALLAGIAAAGFYDDPVMSWVFQDPDDRLAKLTDLFGGLVDDFFPDRGLVHVLDDASVTFWRDPDFHHHPDPSEGPDDGAAGEDFVNPYTDDELGRLVVLGAAMDLHHPHDRHWYLNVVSTRPSHQGRGLGGQLLRPTLDRADEAGVPCYLESTNPRNRSLYYRAGFEDLGDIELDGGPPMRQMWREPQGR